MRGHEAGGGGRRADADLGCQFRQICRWQSTWLATLVPGPSGVEDEGECLDRKQEVEDVDVAEGKVLIIK